MEESSSDSWQGKRCFCSPNNPDWPCGPPSLLIQLIPKNLSIVLKQLGHEAHCSPSCSARSYISTLQYAFMLCTGRTYFSYLPHPGWFWGPSSLLLWAPRTLSQGVFRAENEAGHFHLVLRLEMFYSLRSALFWDVAERRVVVVY